MTIPAIETRALTKTFGKLTAVDHVSLSIPAASVYGFLGPNGSGKSTTIRMLCGLLEPTEGEVSVLGLSVPRESEKLRTRIGYMTQRFSLYSDLSVRENLEFMDQVYSSPRRTRRERIAHQLEKFHLSDRVGQLAGTMSGGQRQRLALAAATLHEPELLFLDEPTSAVDPESRREFWEFLFDMVDEGTTVLVSTHFMDEAERCHHIAILDEGRLVAAGEPVKLKQDLAAAVVEVDGADARGLRKCLIDLPQVFSVAQLGTRLHALVSKSERHPEALIRDTLQTQGMTALVSMAEPSLEDVFVMATLEAT